MGSHNPVLLKILWLVIIYLIANMTTLINPRRACARGLRYLSTCPVCLFVCYHLIVDIVRFYGLSKVRTGVL